MAFLLLKCVNFICFSLSPNMVNIKFVGFGLLIEYKMLFCMIAVFNDGRLLDYENNYLLQPYVDYSMVITLFCWMNFVSDKLLFFRYKSK